MYVVIGCSVVETVESFAEIAADTLQMLRIQVETLAKRNNYIILHYAHVLIKQVYIFYEDAICGIYWYITTRYEVFLLLLNYYLRIVFIDDHLF